MSHVEICPGTFITEECHHRLVAAAEEADKIKLEDCVNAAECSDEQLIELLSRSPRPAINVTGLSPDRLRLVFFGSCE